MAATVRQPKPKKGYPGDNSSTRSVSAPFPISPRPLTLSSFQVAASPPGAERVLLRPSLPVPVMLVFPMALPPPPPLKPCLSPRSVLRHPPLARITKSFFKISRVLRCVLSIIGPSLLDPYVPCSKGDVSHPCHQDRKTL